MDIVVSRVPAYRGILASQVNLVGQDSLAWMEPVATVAIVDSVGLVVTAASRACRVTLVLVGVGSVATPDSPAEVDIQAIAVHLVIVGSQDYLATPDSVEAASAVTLVTVASVGL